MTQTPRSTRRSWVRRITHKVWAIAAAPMLASTSARPLEVDRMLERLEGAHWNHEQRLYRVDAAITVISSALHWFRDVGHGFLSFGETIDGRKATVLRFGATSIPARSAGFDRLGFIEEASYDQEFASFGFITGGYESRASTLSKGYTAMDLFARGRQCWFRRAPVAAEEPSRNDLARLISTVRGALPQTAGQHQQVELAGPHPTFLHALLKAVELPAGQFRCTYVYNAKQFDLSLDRTADPEIAGQLAERRITRRPESVRRYDGFIRDGVGQSTNRQWSFRFWREDHTTNRLPLRIEFQPKPLLRLRLEPAPTRNV